MKTHLTRHVVASSVALALAAFGCAAQSNPDSPALTPPDPGTGSGTSSTKATDFCGASAAYPQRCASTPQTTCDQQIVSTCSNLAGGLINKSLLDAAGECVASAKCGTSPTSCLATALPKAQPTDAHRALAKAYCGQCTAAPAQACEDAFFKTDGDSSALAELILPVGDDLAKSITSKCVGFTCKATFLTCAQGMIGKQLADSLTPDAAQCLLKSLAGNVQSGSSSGDPGSSSGGSTSSGGGSTSSSGGSTSSSGGSTSSSGGSTSSSGGSSSGSAPGTFDIEVLDATVPATKANGNSWDGFGNLPDPFVEIVLTYPNGDTTDEKTSYLSDTLTPQFNQTIITGATADGMGKATVNVLDDDTFANDWIGSCATSLAPQSGIQTVTCDAAHSAYGPGYTLRVQITSH